MKYYLVTVLPKRGSKYPNAKIFVEVMMPAEAKDPEGMAKEKARNVLAAFDADKHTTIVTEVNKSSLEAA